MKHILIVAACASVLVPNFALAQNAPVSEPAPSVTAPSSNPAGEPLICRYYYYNGRLLPRRDCRTAKQWQRVRLDTQQNITDFQLRALTRDR